MRGNRNIEGQAVEPLDYLKILKTVLERRALFLLHRRTGLRSWGSFSNSMFYIKHTTRRSAAPLHTFTPSTRMML
jgi:hypothetical protein